MKPKDYKKIVFSVRVSEDLFNIVNNILPQMKIERREFTELAFFNLIEKLDKNKLKLDGFDFITYAKVRKARLLRQMESIHRTEIKSKAMFIQRVEFDLLEMLLVLSPLTEIKKLIIARKQEANHYDKPEHIINILNKYSEITEKDYNHTISYLKEKINNIEFVKHQKKKMVKMITNGDKQKNVK